MSMNGKGCKIVFLKTLWFRLTICSSFWKTGGRWCFSGGRHLWSFWRVWGFSGGHCIWNGGALNLAKISWKIRFLQNLDRARISCMISKTRALFILLTWAPLVFWVISERNKVKAKWVVILIIFEQLNLCWVQIQVIQYQSQRKCNN